MAFKYERENFHKNFSTQIIKEIRNRYVKEHETQLRLAEDYGCSLKLIWNIIHLKVYKDVPVEDNYAELLKER